MGLSDIIGVGTKILDKVIPDPQARDAAKIRLIELSQAGELAALQAGTELLRGQHEINRIEAGSPSLFVSGWRPFIGWVCGMGLSYQFLLRPIASALFGGTWVELDVSTLMTLLTGMLGLGGLRTFEKLKGVTR